MKRTSEQHGLVKKWKEIYQDEVARVTSLGAQVPLPEIIDFDKPDAFYESLVVEERYDANHSTDKAAFERAGERIREGFTSEPRYTPASKPSTRQIYTRTEQRIIDSILGAD